MECGHLRRYFLLLPFILFLSSCNADGSCNGEIICSLELEVDEGVYLPGDRVKFVFNVWTSEEVKIRLFDDPLCSLDFHAGIGRFEEKSTVVCSPNPFHEEAIVLDLVSQGTHYKARSIYGRSSSRRVGPSLKYSIEAIAAIGVDKSDPEVVMLMFDSNVYFSFRGGIYARFSIRPTAGLFASEVGSFRSRNEISFSKDGTKIVLDVVGY